MTAAEWDGLAHAGRNVFATREWLETWQRHEPSPAGSTTLVARRPDGTPAALLPLTMARSLPRVLRPTGPWPAPERPLISAPEDADWAVRELAGQLRDRGGWDVLALESVPVGQPWTEELTGRSTAPQADRVIPLAGRTWEQLLGAASKNVRASIRRRDRRLRERYRVDVRLADRASLHADVDTFLGLHWARWGDEVKVLTPRRAAFVHEFAEVALERGWFRLSTMDLDRRPVAADLSLRYAGTEVVFMAGMDPAFRDSHAGMALHYHLVREAIADGVEEFRFLRGDQPYKDNLPNVNRPVSRVVLTGSLTGRLAVAARAARSRLREAARRRGQAAAPGAPEPQPSPATAEAA